MPEYIVKTLFGLEDVLANELVGIGASSVKKYNRAVGFTGDKKMLYRANYYLRTALKILVPIGETDIANEKELYDSIRNIRWDKYMGINDTLAVEVALSTDLFRHTQYIAQKIKDAIVDQFRDKYGARPSVDLEYPTLRINAHISNKTLKLSRDSSGDSLHRRGYRFRQGPAPLNEVLAAGLIMLAGWDGRIPLVDFMCGSGTIPVEAALLACGIPPGDLRQEYGFQKWRDYELRLFQEVVNERKPGRNNREIQIFASDISGDAVKLARRHAQNAGVLKNITFQNCHFMDFTPPQAPGVIVINPPYGERVVQQNLNELYSQLGDKLKKSFCGYDAWIISANAEAVKNIGLRTSKKLKLYNGQLECRFNMYSLFEGSKKASASNIS
jgi:putative N6-adenine-specific DNA methylase